MKLSFGETFFPSFRSFSRVFQTTLQIDDKRIYCAADEHFGAGSKAQNTFFLLYYSDNRFSAGDKHVESSCSNFRPQSYTCSYQRFSSRAYLEIATHRHSPSQMGGSHALVLTREYATPTSYIRNSVLCWTSLS